ncbi:MAG: hypothetical protein K2K94_02450, partial [Muribaculaceae bacterium]|nr:hypothetical protein [Muribaculaceae bacterium]
MLETIQRLDSSIFLFFNSHHNEFFDNFMSLYSGRFIWIPMYAALLIVMLRRFPLVKVLLLLSLIHNSEPTSPSGIGGG